MPPDFLLVGAAKCGTSALHNALAGHPDLFLSTPKEPKFFLTDGPPPDSGGGPGDVPTWGEHVWRRADYEALFAAAPPGALRGESTVFYLYDPEAQRRIAKLVPQAKLIAVLRDPVERAHSNWAHLRGAELEPEADFLRALELEEERIAAGWAHFWHYAAQGRYGEQLDQLFSLVPREQVLLLRYRELRDDPVTTADRVCAFLGVPTGLIAGVPRHHVRPDVHGRTSGPTAAERAAALPRFAADLPRVAAHTGWDLSDWAQ
ncbi:sulfotransferase [Pseudonocardia sp. WMMC193]|uniref:sulfotransferase family protein n=1 Tax=Pseudonocardia sp. WMMC193 TaxID=2911965 RepID=UPI001F396FBA|nr:sulfotransferase [Pseudonocardia sp. WMMC193]MCF7549368.1 sulfotransferase [Pseudonocardia sp. WMMC193]